MEKITLKIDENIELDVAFNYAKNCVIDFVTNDYKNCMYMCKKPNISCFIKKSKANNLIVLISDENTKDIISAKKF
jgi:hypothetical protein